MTRVLIVDDDRDLLRWLEVLLGQSGYDVVLADHPEQGLARALSEPFDVIFCDVQMPGFDGLTFLKRYRDKGGPALVLMMSAFGNESLALEAMREGAYDYLPKPLRADEVILILRKAEEREGLRREVAGLRATIESGGAGLVAESKSMRQALELAVRVAGHRTPILITGENGTGKEVIARLVHRQGPRHAARFMVFNLAAIPDQLVESELFGHEAGSMPGVSGERAGLLEEARGGTLLLDEISLLPLGLQNRLLQVLETGLFRRVGGTEDRPVDLRIIAATAQHVDKLVQAGKFREALFHRLNVVRIHLPPLRERLEDIPALATQFVAQAGARQGRSLRLTPAALGRILEWTWPGNVRELRNALERGAVLSTTGVLDAPDFLFGDPRQPGATSMGVGRLKPQVEALERSVIEQALGRTNGNRRAAATALGVSLRTLFYKLHRYGLGD